MKGRFLPLLTTMLLLGGAAPGIADDDARNAAERARDRREIRQDRRALADDAADRDWIEDTLNAFVHARTYRDAEALSLVDERVAGYLAAETGESGREILRARRELRGDRREVRSDRRDIRDNRASDAAPAERADDRRDLRDDRRDLRDDRRDLGVGVSRKDTLTAIRDEWLELQGIVDRETLDRKETLLRELAGMAGAQVIQDRGEIREDRGERREDRRERKESRRES